MRKTAMLLMIFGLLLVSGQAFSAETPLRQAGINLIPYPQMATLGGEEFLFDSPVSVVTDPGAGEQEIFAAEELIRGLREEQGIQNVAQGGAGAKKIVLSLKGAAEKLGPQGYSLETAANQVTVRAITPAGLFYGVQTLVQSVVPLRGGLGIPGLKIQDWPDIPDRAVHYDTKHFQENADYVKNFIRELARYKINTLIWEWEDKFEYQSHPEVGAPGAFTPAQMREFTQYAKKYHVQIVPLVQGLGHVSFILKHPKNIPLREVASDNWGFCPLNEKTYEFMFALLKEAAEATPGSEYLHIGCDETYVLGKGVECGCQAKMAEVGRYGLRQIYINRVSEYVKKLGRKPMSWAGGYEAREKMKPTAGLMTPGGYNERQDSLSLANGYPLYIYDPNPGIEHLFLPYFYKETIYSDYGTHLENSYRQLPPAAISGKFQGMISTSWNCSGVHNNIWMLRYITAAEYSWSGKNPGLDEFEDKFFENYYGPQSRDVRELYELLNKGSYYYMSTFERKVWHWGEIGKTHLPDLPRDDIEYDPYWNTEYKEMLTRAREIPPRMERAQAICEFNRKVGTRNAYDFELFDRLAELFTHTARTYQALSSLENTITEAHKLHFPDHAAAYATLGRAARIVQGNLDERAEVYGKIVATWEKSQLPRGMSTPQKKYVHGRDQQRNFANRRPDLSFMICDEEQLNLEGYLADLKKYMAWYSETYGPFKTGPAGSIRMSQGEDN